MRQIPILALGAIILVSIAVTDYLIGRHLTGEQIRLNTQIEETHIATTDLVSAIGYGGVIHNFKNYVLRSEARYRDAAQASIERAEREIEQLLAISHREGMSLTYGHTREMLAAYQARLGQVRAYVQDDLRPGEIDDLVVFDDGPALAEISANREQILDTFLERKASLTGVSAMKNVLSLALLLLVTAAGGLLFATQHRQKFHTALKAEHERTLNALKDNRRLNDELIDANKRLEQYSYLVAHDLKSPFRQISMLAHMANLKVDGAHEAKPLLSKINECTEQAELIIQSFLGLAQMKHPFKDIEVFELSDSFKYAQRNCRYSADTGFTLKFGDLGQVQGDRGLINQLAVNLINNSVKYARPNVEALIHVTSEVDGEFLHVHVKDNGVGISPKHIGSVFEPLYRAPTKTPTAKGTGLGLSICKSIVEAHGGKICVTSTTLNDGAIFSFTLPLPAEQFLGGSPELQAEAEAETFPQAVNGPH